MGIHELVTGLNGAGKSLYTVAEKLRPLVGTTVQYKGNPIPVRLVVGGIRDLLLPHEIMDVPELDPEGFVDEFKDQRREPGTPAREDVVCSILNWWLWCQPGDVIVVDECQRVFRPMASGRRVPMFVSKLETARHYGVQFVYVTQHPQLIHTNVRNLVGPIEDVSRVFGGSRTLVRQWDRIGDYGKKASATTRMWKHDKAAFGLYKSAELHTKFSARIPLAVWGVGVGLVLLLVVGWILKGRLAERFTPPDQVKTKTIAQSPGGGSAPGQPGAMLPAVASALAGPATWPMYEAVPVVVNREPLAGRGVQVEGQWSGGGVSGALFGLLIEGERVASITLAELVKMGYSYTSSGPCVGVLRFGVVERLVTCGKAPARVERPAAPAEPAPVAVPAVAVDA